MTYENYPPLPPGKYAFALQGDEVFYSESQLREAQRQMAHKCLKALEEAAVQFAHEQSIWVADYMTNLLFERFGPFDE